MEKYKLCPVCGFHNNPLFLECAECETDLQNVPLTDPEAQQSETTTPVTNEAEAVMVRICDCGTKNPFHARRCSQCGEDISDIMPVPDEEPAEMQYLLTSLDGVYAYEIPEGVTNIGREQVMGEYLSGKPFVSRKHAILTLDAQNQVLTIQNCSNTNYTFVNNQMLRGDQSIPLNDGDEIGLGGYVHEGQRQEDAAYFLVRIGQCT